MRRASLFLLAVLAIPLAAQTRLPAPPPPEKYAVDIRYRIDAFRNERAAQFKELVQSLKALGFERDPDDEAKGEDNLEVQNASRGRMHGTIGAANARKIAGVRNVLTVLLRPAGSDPLVGEKPIRAEIEVVSGVGGASQRVLADQLLYVLGEIKFRQPIGYDNRGYTRLVGALPAGQFEAVLNDVRRLPVAWVQPKDRPGFGLPKSLLSDLRKTDGGNDSLRNTLLAWSEHPEGSKLLIAALGQWAQNPIAYRYIVELPPLVVDDSTLLREIREAELKRVALPADTKARLAELMRKNVVVREHMLTHLQRTPESAAVLQGLFDEVQKSKAGPELMDILLRTLEDREGGFLLPPLFRSRRVVRVIEARPDLPVPEPKTPSPTVPEAEHKIAPSLREIVKDAARAGALTRLEIILSGAPGALDRDWLGTLAKAAPSLIVEGRAGAIVSGRMKPSEVAGLIRLPLVAAVRLPREATSAVLNLPDEEGDPAKVLKETGLEPILRLGKPLRPVRVAVIDSDFRGWERLVGSKLPANTRLLDLTLERSEELKADPFVTPGEKLGPGTQTALALALAAPWCELVLVRVDPAAPHHLVSVLRRLNGEEGFSESLLARRTDLLRARQYLALRREALRKEREEIYLLFPDDRPQEEPFAKKRQELFEAHRKKQAQFDADEKAYFELEKVYLRYITDLRDLRNVRVVVCGLNWETGHPVDGGSDVSRLIEATPGRFLWIQAAGNARDQAWSGLFRDADGNGVMEFAEATAPLPAGNWNHELAFLAWQPWKGERAKLLPAKTRFRITMQWREAHDPNYTRNLEDPFRGPLSHLRLLVVRQFDPEGKKRPADDLAILTETQGPPTRLVAEEGSAVYEHIIEFQADAGSRLALRVEGTASKSTRPPETADLPHTEQSGEVRPRILVEALDGDGRAVFESYTGGVGVFGTPADAKLALCVGALSAARKPQPYASEGVPNGMELLEKPDVRTFDRLGLDGLKQAGGSGMSAGLVGGYAASLLAHGTNLEDLARELKSRLKPVSFRTLPRSE